MAISKHIEKYGITKISLVIICLLTFSFFTAFILNGFWGIGAELCNQYIPYLACNGVYNFSVSIGAILISMFGPLSAYKILLKFQMWKLGLIALFFLTISLIGGYILKHRYEKLSSAK
jgi:hypothetical protein